MPLILTAWLAGKPVIVASSGAGTGNFFLGGKIPLGLQTGGTPPPPAVTTNSVFFAMNF